MIESVGQALRAARLKQNLSIEEVSHATKIRAARIADLENDEYMRFPNITYARSFLVLYAKFLGVDITKYPTVESGSTVGLADYQYLQSEGKSAPKRAREEQKGPPPKPRWLTAFFVFLAMLAIGALIGWSVMNFQRLGSVENLLKKQGEGSPAPSPLPTATPVTPPPKPPVMLVPPVTPAAVVPTPTVEPMASPVTAATPQSAEIPPASPAALTAASSPLPEPLAATPALALSGSPTLAPAIRPIEMVNSGSSDAAILDAATAVAATPVPAATAEPVFPPPGTLREIKVRVTKKIKVRIMRDTPTGSSLYFGFVNPLQPVLTYKGRHFWIKTSDPEALQVTVNDQPASGLESGVEVILSPGL